MRRAPGCSSRWPSDEDEDDEGRYLGREVSLPIRYKGVLLFRSAPFPAFRLHQGDSRLRPIQVVLGFGFLSALVLSGCGNAGEAGGLTGTVQSDGSSTVYPITEAVAEEFTLEMGYGVDLILGQSGTGGGFKRFCAGEIDISNASRPISETEKRRCEDAGVEYVELKIAMDGLAVLVHPQNTFAECLTVDELRRVWEPSSRISNWSQVRQGFPNQRLVLYGPGTNSGTFDYFTEVIGGHVGSSRPDYSASEDDNVLVQGVSGDVNSLGYFGYAYYVTNQGRVKVLAIDSGEGCVRPDAQSIESGRYAPLSRPLLLYVNRASLADPAVREFVEFYLETASVLATEVGYVPLSDAAYDAERAKLAEIPDA
jgi:phosphate transport system substrate-binding protein